MATESLQTSAASVTRSAVTSTGDGVRAATWRALTAAAEDVAVSWELSEYAATSAADIRSSLGVLADAVPRAATGEAPSVGGMPPFVPARRALIWHLPSAIWHLASGIWHDMFHNVNHMLGEFEHLVLLAVLRLGDDAYGVTIRRDIESRLGRDLSTSATYVTLERLEGKGLVRSWVGEPTAERGGRRRKHFALKPAGRKALAASHRAFRVMAAGLEDQLERP